MTTIEKLGISGIRSYGPDNEAVIKFYKPLTIILGQNGSGKSTIIEAVKMATTGDLPPMVSQGAAFINDPRIRSVTETNAKIRLQFTNVRGEEYLVSRHFLLKMTRSGKAEFKTVDQTLKRNRSRRKRRRRRRADGEEDGDEGQAAEEDDEDDYRQNSTSHRCAELNALLPDLMRVTKPILNSVIFVHQEDSLWPLADPKKLKERFDDIFSATRYTKALESIRKFRKEQSSELRVVNSELLRHEDRAKACEKLREESNDIRSKEAKLRAGVDAVQGEMAELKREMTRAKKIQAEYVALQEKLTSLDAKIAVQEKDRAEKYDMLTENLNEMQDDELEKLIDDLDDAMRRSEGEKRDRAAALEMARNELEDLSKTYNVSQKRNGTMQAEALQQMQRVDGLERLKRQLQKQFFTGVESQASLVDQVPVMDSNYDVWSVAIDTLRDQARRKVRALAAERHAVEDVASEAVGDAQLKLSTTKTQIGRNKDLASKKRALAAKKREELRSISQGTTKEEITAAKQEQIDCEKQHEQVRKSDRLAKANSAFAAAKAEARTVQQQLHDLKRERDLLARDNDARVAMQHRKKEYEEKQKKLVLLTEDLLEKAQPIYDAHGIKKGGLDDAGESEVSEVGRHDNSTEALEQEKNQEAALRLVASILKYQHRVVYKADAKLSAATIAHTAAKAKSGDRKKALQQLETAMDREEHELAKIRGNLSDDMRRVVKDVDLMAKTCTRLDGGRVTMNEANCVALGELERVAVAEVARLSTVIKTTKATAESAVMTLQSFESEGYCLHCGHEADLKPLVTEEDCVDASSSRQKKAQISAIKAFVFKKATAEQKAQRENITKLKNEATEASTDASHETPKALKAAERMVAWSKQIMRIGDRLLGLSSRLSDAREEAAASESDATNTGKVVRAAKFNVEELSQQFGQNSEVQEVAVFRNDVARCSGERDTAYKALLKSRASLPVDSGVRTISEVDGEIRSLEQSLSKAQERVEESRLRIDAAKEEQVRAEGMFAKARENVLVLMRNFERQGRLESEKKELAEASRVLEAEAGTLKADLAALEEELTLARGEYETIRAESARLIEAANTNAGVVEKSYESWSTLLRAFEAYKKLGKEAELARLERHMQATKENIQKLQIDVRQHTKDTESAGDSLREKSADLRNATDNQRYRALQKQLEMYQSQARDARTDVERLVTASTRMASEALAKTEARRHGGNTAAGVSGAFTRPQIVTGDDVVDLGGPGESQTGNKENIDWGGKRAISRMDPNGLVDEFSRQYGRKNALCHATQGKAQAYTERWTLKQLEIQEADRLGSMKKYEECRITKQTMELASSDLDRYHRALDQALMSFHALKMDNINKSIRELWQTTYRGNDIDEIEIVSDAAGGDGKTGSAAAKRNYNYRVMMRRGDAKLDMRGRCSAGQKVLACLVIRLALAESFCTDCGILALDEPTTNLDRDNVDSLAAALRAIIENRRKQAHFQLILISHDQDFLSMMSARSFCDSYHLIHKDATGNSVS